VYISASNFNMGMHSEQIRAEAVVRAILELVAHQMSGMAERSGLIGSVGFELGGVNAIVDFEGGLVRIDLNNGSKYVMGGLFRSLGAAPAQADDQAARIEAWRKRPQAGTTSEEVALYRNAGLRYGPRENPFPHVAELANVLHMSDALMTRLMPLVTVYSNE